nr:reverse transcriptase domain-containing protein [Tanacetum cinerariifolium]
TNLRYEITRFQQRFDESFYEAWERFNDILWACPHHGFSELHQLDTLYNALNVNDQDSLNSAAGENFLDKMPREYMKIIESKSKVRQLRAKSQGQSMQNQCQNVQNQYQNLQNQMAALTNMVSKLVSANAASSSGSGTLPADFVVVDFEPDPRVPLILGRCFLKTSRALIDVHKGELTLRIRNEAITYNLDQTVRYSSNYNQMTANKIDVIESACKEYSQEILVDAFLDLEDDPDSLKINPFYYDPEGDILLLEGILNSKPSPPLPNQEQNLPSFKEELKAYEAQTVKSSVDEPPEVEIKDLPYHLEYAFLEGDNKLPIIISKELRSEEKAALIKVLKSHKRAIAWKLSDIQGINPEFCTHKILMEEDYKSAVQHQRQVNPKIHDVIKKEVEKLLDAGLIYPTSDSPWVSPVHCVPKKCCFTVVENEENELILTCLVTEWRVCIDYRKLNKAT